MKFIYEWLCIIYFYIRFGVLNEHIVDVIACVACEIEYKDRNGRIVGYWAYGFFQPNLPFQGQPIKTKEHNK